VRDIATLSAVYVVESLLQNHPRGVVADDTDIYVESEPGRFERYELRHRASCRGATVAEAF
jgi:uncharacterized protein YjiK